MRFLSSALLLLAASISPAATLAFQASPFVEGNFHSTATPNRITSSLLRATGQGDGATTTVVDESSSGSVKENSTGKSMTERMMAKAPQEGQYVYKMMSLTVKCRIVHPLYFSKLHLNCTINLSPRAFFFSFPERQELEDFPLTMHFWRPSSGGQI